MLEGGTVEVRVLAQKEPKSSPAKTGKHQICELRAYLLKKIGAREFRNKRKIFDEK